MIVIPHVLTFFKRRFKPKDNTFEPYLQEALKELERENDKKAEENLEKVVEIALYGGEKQWK